MSPRIKNVPGAAEGILVLDKPAGMTSHDCVNKIRRIFNTKRVGHCGTLDPLATGVLVVCLGQATRIVEYLTATEKIYTSTAEFGRTTDSQDRTGTTLTTTSTINLTRSDLEDALLPFRGDILQMPPMVSALHHEGQRLYDLARQGIEVDRDARPITIDELTLLSFEAGESATATFRIRCSTGTYIRTIIHDIGDVLKVGGVMTELRRNSVGNFDLGTAHTLEELNELTDQVALRSLLVPMTSALADWEQLTLTASEESDIRLGRQIPAVTIYPDGSRLLLVSSSGNPVALAKAIDAQIAPFKVFSEL